MAKCNRNCDCSTLCRYEVALIVLCVNMHQILFITHLWMAPNSVYLAWSARNRLSLWEFCILQQKWSWWLHSCLMLINNRWMCMDAESMCYSALFLYILHKMYVCVCLFKTCKSAAQFIYMYTLANYCWMIAVPIKDFARDTLFFVIYLLWRTLDYLWQQLDHSVLCGSL